MCRKRAALKATYATSTPGYPSIRDHLLNIRVQLKYLSLSFHLSDADLTGELRHGQATSLQVEGAVQGSLTATPDVIKRDFLPHEVEKKGWNNGICNGTDTSVNQEATRGRQYFFFQTRLNIQEPDM